MQQLLQQVILGNSLLNYLLSVGIFGLGVLLIRFVLKRILLEELRKRLTASRLLLDDTLIQISERYLIPLLYIGLAYLCLDSLSLNDSLTQGLNVIATILFTFLGINLLSAAVEYFLRVYLARRRGTAMQQSILELSPMIRIVFGLIGVLFLLDNLGFNVASLVASLGIGGVAIALASQGVLQDLFSYFSILFDRPFEIGDFIILGDYMGSVEYIGIKTTRLRSLGGEQLVLANTDITSSRIRNYKRMKQRRVVFTFGVTYSTSGDHLQAIPKLIEEIVQATPNTSFDRAHFSRYGDFSLDFEVVYYVNSSDYTIYMDTQQAINLGIKTAFESRQIEFAYPTQVLYLNSPVTGSAERKSDLADR